MSDFLQECGYAQTSEGADHKPQQDSDTAADLHLRRLPRLSPFLLQIKGEIAYHQWSVCTLALFQGSSTPECDIEVVHAERAYFFLGEHPQR